MEESCVFIIRCGRRSREKKALGYNGARFYVQSCPTSNKCNTDSRGRLLAGKLNLLPCIDQRTRDRIPMWTEMASVDACM